MPGLRQRADRRFAKYAKAFELGLQAALEYRANFALSLLSAAYPIFIQTFLWTAIYQASPGAEIYGYTYRQMLAYTFLAGLVTRIVRTGFEYEIMDDIKNGRYSTFLVKPQGYFPYRLCAYFGNKLPGLAMILGVMAVALVGLSAVFGVSVEAWRIPVFLATLALAAGLNFLIFYGISSVAFWLVEIGFLFEGIRIVTILLSGGIFPLEVFGDSFVQLMRLLPFQYTVSFPIQVLNGKLDPAGMAQGILVQCFWIAACWALANGLWRLGSRRYVAVGG